MKYSSKIFIVRKFHTTALLLLSASVHMRVLELSADIASVYVCGYAEEDGRCQRDRSNFIIVGRNRRVDMPPGVLALYSYQATGLCLDQFDAEFHNITPPACKLFSLFTY